MNTFGHCLLSQKKFGGEPEDYQYVHAFIDSSKYFLYHAKHRVCLHNLFGVELVTKFLGNTLVNSDGKTILVEQVALEHCKEDMSGYIPSLNDYFMDNLHLEELLPTEFPSLDNPVWDSFLQRPYEMSGLRVTLAITYSDFGTKLLEYFYGNEAVEIFKEKIKNYIKIRDFLTKFQFTHTWQYTVNKEDSRWLGEYYRQNPEREINGMWLLPDLKEVRVNKISISQNSI